MELNLKKMEAEFASMSNEERVGRFYQDSPLSSEEGRG
ncbi:hypothetical protein A45J_2530 [hot springs metagenome]|uniref:Uncharacterized protein n=1 Tax=hot springs metagenome TaxID=433727 RepID=A0A5J4LB22_9ZZZZ